MSNEHIRGEAALREAIDVCEAENSNLRRHLMWAAYQMSPENRRLLLSRIRGKTIEDGGITSNGESERADRDKAIDAICNHIDIAAQMSGRLPGNWYTRADHLANVLRGFLSPSTEAERSAAELADHLFPPS